MDYLYPFLSTPLNEMPIDKCIFQSHSLICYRQDQQQQQQHHIPPCSKHYIISPELVIVPNPRFNQSINQSHLKFACQCTVRNTATFIGWTLLLTRLSTPLLSQHSEIMAKLWGVLLYYLLISSNRRCWEYPRQQENHQQITANCPLLTELPRHTKS